MKNLNNVWEKAVKDRQGLTQLEIDILRHFEVGKTSPNQYLVIHTQSNSKKPDAWQAKIFTTEEDAVEFMQYLANVEGKPKTNAANMDYTQQNAANILLAFFDLNQPFGEQWVSEPGKVSSILQLALYPVIGKEGVISLTSRVASPEQPNLGIVKQEEPAGF